ncbi:hypothetical protein GCM10010320_72750 [Streptomyces caelestis]|nr:hypothetical protein GCM10010320_72750 [Streptomyces caelestis]
MIAGASWNRAKSTTCCPLEALARTDRGGGPLHCAVPVHSTDLRRYGQLGAVWIMMPVTVKFELKIAVVLGLTHKSPVWPVGL